MPGTHADKRLNISASPFELGCQSVCLLLSQAAQWGSTTDLAVIALRRSSTQCSYRVSNGLSQGRKFYMYDFGIREQPVQKRLHVAQRFGSTKIEQKNRDFHCECW